MQAPSVLRTNSPSPKYGAPERPHSRREKLQCSYCSVAQTYSAPKNGERHNSTHEATHGVNGHSQACSPCTTFITGSYLWHSVMITVPRFRGEANAPQQLSQSMQLNAFTYVYTGRRVYTLYKPSGAVWCALSVNAFR